MIIAIYQALIAHPLLNILVGLYQTIAFRDLGVAIIILTLIIRAVLYPVFQKSMRYQAKMQELQPKLKALQDEHKGDYQKQSQAMMDLYKEHEVSPFSGIGLLIVQLPILFALYHLFLNIFKPDVLTHLYSFIPHPDVLGTTFLGIIALDQRSIVLVVIAALAQYIQIRLTLRKNTPIDASQRTMAQIMSIVGPVLTVVIFANLPAAVSLYWLISSIVSVGQQYVINRQYNTPS